MKTTNRTPIAGALTRSGDRSAGRWCRNGSGTRLLELGHQLEPTSLRITEFAPAIPPVTEQAAASPTPAAGYGPPATATRLGKRVASRGKTFLSSLMGRSGVQQGTRFLPMSDEERADGSLRMVYAASIRSCRPCPLREQCQWQGSATSKPRQVSVLLHPLGVRPAPVLWKDWSRRQHRRACMQLLRCQRVEVQMEQALSSSPDASPPIL